MERSSVSSITTGPMSTERTTPRQVGTYRWRDADSGSAALRSRDRAAELGYGTAAFPSQQAAVPSLGCTLFVGRRRSALVDFRLRLGTTAGRRGITGRQ